MSNAYPACLVRALGLSTADLGEIGGFSDRYARDILSGAAPCKPDVLEALELIQNDVDVITDSMVSAVQDVGFAAIYVFRNKAELREHFPHWPGRGFAAGGFPGPHQIAALTALEALRDAGITDIPILFLA